MKQADLHVHTTASDGTYTPRQVVELAGRLGLSALGICDHDTTEGVAEAQRASADGSVEIVPGVEISAYLPGAEVHVLGYYTRSSDPEFCSLLNRLRQSRYERLHEMVKRLVELGVDIVPEHVLRIAGGSAPGRPHVARTLVETGHVRDVSEAFSQYLDVGKPAYVERYKLSPRQAICAVRKAGGVPVLAHPGLSGVIDSISGLKHAGLMGIEVYHPAHDGATERLLCELALRYSLLITGGSDCHGCAYAHLGELGQVRLNYHHVEELKSAADSVRRAGA